MKLNRIVVLLMTALMLSACGGDDDKSKDKQNSNGQSQVNQGQSVGVSEDDGQPREATIRAIVESALPENSGISIVSFEKQSCENRGQGKYFCNFTIKAERLNPESGQIEQNTVDQSGLFWKENGKWLGTPSQNQQQSNGDNATQLVDAQTPSGQPEPTEQEMRDSIEASKPDNVDLTIVNFKKEQCQEKQDAIFVCSFVTDIDSKNPQTNVLERWTHRDAIIFKKIDGVWRSSAAPQ